MLDTGRNDNMKRTISYEKFLDKIYGCYVGKAVSGNIGAPYEGVKMPMELEFMPQMINCDLPNDDLDLQVLWLDVVERKGADFQAYDLLKSFCENCDYSPGEYAVMRKNYARGVYPPYSGKFCNDFYIEGMGCPIRSEVWGCLAVGNMQLAAEFASRDGQLDHYGESILAEQFMSALESEAFFENDLHKLINHALTVLPEASAFRKLVLDTMRWCEEYRDIKLVLKKILFHYGHPDCTNMYQNMGITIASLILGEGDIIKTSMMALNCGFDTDCTCASAGAVIGLLRGAKELKSAYGLDEVTYKLAVRSERRSDKIFDLAEDIAKLAVEFSKDVNEAINIEGAPAVSYEFEKTPDFTFEVRYKDMNPSVVLGGTCEASGVFVNHTSQEATLNCCISTDSNLYCNLTDFVITVAPRSEEYVALKFTLPKDVQTISDKNIIRVKAMCGKSKVIETDFGVCGATPWKLTGPFWRTEPIITTEKVMKNINLDSPYQSLMPDSSFEGNLMDKVRHFHLNFEPDQEMNFVEDEELFSPAKEDEEVVFTSEDSFRVEQFFGLKGPCTVYLSRVIVMEQDDEVFMQIGHTCPFKLYINGELIASRSYCTTWTAENVHLAGIKLKKGENRVVLRITRVNEDAKLNVTFSRALATGTQIVDLVSKNPYVF